MSVAYPLVMQIRYIDGPRFKRAFAAGARSLMRHKDYLNRINVFPVADSDTGTNMAGTLGTIVKGLERSTDDRLSATMRTIAECGLDGARGNSGTILAQYFYGLATELKDSIRASTDSFADAARRAVDYAYSAIRDPKEGTLLSVMRDWAESIHRNARKTKDFAELLATSLQAAKLSLERTRDQLAVLRRAHVVDAGGLGFVSLIEGMTRFMRGDSLGDSDDVAENGVRTDVTPPTGESAIGTGFSAGNFKPPEPAYRYCTECTLKGAEVDNRTIYDLLEDLGDSCIIAGPTEARKIHIHTDEPGRVFELLGSYGEVAAEKADDMKRQFTVTTGSHAECALVVDSTCDLPSELMDGLRIHMVPIRLELGDRSYLDKIAVRPKDFYAMMRNRPDIVPSTSQPSVGDFARVFEFLSEHYRSILFIGISSKLSGTLNSAGNAAERPAEGRREKIGIVDSTKVSVAIGLLARRVGEAIGNALF